MKMNLSILSGLFAIASADIQWPLYSQQCTDDAGPPVGDDAENFGPNGKYHDGSAAYPVLNGRECADPMKDACNSRDDFKTAYLEGPISCGGNGWYCRIFDDSANGWPTENLLGDVNFGQCNREDSFEDSGYDQDGHCHGSSDDSTYYWWMRDHWHRGYNGKLRCCCGWYQGGSQPLYGTYDAATKTGGSRIANGCDYRKLIASEVDANNCRDANEEHNLGFVDIGCDPQFRAQIGSPIPEDDSVCWEVERFGFSEGGYPLPTLGPTTVGQTLKPTPLPVSTAVPTESLAPTPKDVTPSPTKSPTLNPTSNPTTPNPTDGESGENFRVVVLGKGGDPDRDGVVEVIGMNDSHAVRCCRECTNGCGDGWREQCPSYDDEIWAKSILGGCHVEDFCTASDICADKGGRLCTPEEVLESCTKGTGCNFDRELIWACMYEEGECTLDEECCSGKCGEDECLPADPGMCGV